MFNSQNQQEQLNAKDKFSKLELAMSMSRSKYTAKFVDDEVEKLVVKNEDLMRQIDSILVVLKKSSMLWKDFINAHGRAVVTLTQVDTKLTQLELLDRPDDVIEKPSAQKTAKDLGNLQVKLKENFEQVDG